MQMRSVAGSGGGATGSWSDPISIDIDLIPSTTLPPTFRPPSAGPVSPDESNMDLVLGLSIPFAIIAAVILALIVFLCIYIAFRQFKLRRSLKVCFYVC